MSFKFKDKGFSLYAAVLLLLLGFIFSVYTQRYTGFTESELTSTRKLQQLIAILKETQVKNQNLETQIQDLNSQMNKIKKEGVTVKLANKRLKEIYSQAGFTNVKGAGIVVKIDDSNNVEFKNVDFNTLLSSEDLLKIVNELKATGASAISVNGQRVVTTTEVVTAGNAIVMNKTKLIPPYEIKALGPVDTMTSALKMRGGIVEYLEVFGIKIKIIPSENVEIPAYSEE